ncbi:hypothetical protein [Ideonella sp.]|uniref:hypothetical protein n=1 Tax=Ideonella sp. TaxID=1929293 RepID=UPI0035B400D9
MSRFQPVALVLAALTTTALLGGVGALADTQDRQVVSQASGQHATAVAAAQASTGPFVIVVGHRLSL